ncbi:hypothetical protein OV079_25410 [Nannocystis pusilla]|uniref:Uncharacterized protein n=1 Tax=Nannocystis pusilla TaxID=889268 RepID=A0A9X3IZQ1_9BACT|nr:hypothetical protein [Nannocystis pusilla]MCY1008834.1 hypothetical protein [Nannocystis pusilla]
MNSASGRPSCRAVSASRRWSWRALGRQGADDQGAAAVVQRLDAGRVVAAAELDQPRGVQAGQAGVDVGRVAEGPREQAGRQRGAGGGHQVERGAVARGEVVDPRLETCLEGQGLGGELGEVGVGELVDQRLEHVRVAAGLVGDRRGPRLGRQAGGDQEGARGRVGVALVEAADVEAGDVELGQHAQLQALELVADQRRAGPLGVVGDDQQQRRGVGRGQQLGQQAHAVGVAPVEVVEEQDQAAARGQGGEQALERGEGLAPRLLVGHAGAGALGQLAHRRDPLQHREHARELAGVGAEQRRELERLERAEVVGEGVDQTVERLERDGLVLVAAGREGDDVAARLEGAEEAVDEARLADAGLAAQVDAGGAAAGGGGEALVERVELGLATEQHRAAGHRRRRRQRRAAAPRQQLGPGGPLLGVAAQQLADQRRQVLRQAGAARRGRLLALLGEEDLRVAAGERQLAGERLVEHHADGVPVAGRGRELAGALLRRHVKRSARGRLVVVAAGDRGDQAEVEDDDAAARGDEHVRRLEVAVEQALLVQRGDAEHELADQRAQAAVAVGRAHEGAERRAQVDAADVLHRDEPQVALRVQLVQRDEVRVADLGHAAELVLEAVQLRGAHAEQRLHGDALARARVGRLVYGAHAAGAERAQDPVRADLAGQCGRRRRLRAGSLHDALFGRGAHRRRQREVRQDRRVRDWIATAIVSRRRSPAARGRPTSVRGCSGGACTCTGSFMAGEPLAG